MHDWRNVDVSLESIIIILYDNSMTIVIFFLGRTVERLMHLRVIAIDVRWRYTLILGCYIVYVAEHLG